MHEWMQQNPRPGHPQFDRQALMAAHQGGGGLRDFITQWQSQLGDWRDQMHDWRSDRRDFRQGGMQGGPVMTPGGGGGGGPLQGGQNTQFPLNPGAGGPIQGQQIPGSSYGFNLGDVFSRFPNGMGSGQPGPNPGY